MILWTSKPNHTIFSMTPAHTKDIMVFFQDQQVCALGDLENIFSYQNQFVEIFLHIIFNVKIKIKQFVKLQHLMTPKKKKSMFLLGFLLSGILGLRIRLLFVAIFVFDIVSVVVPYPHFF